MAMLAEPRRRQAWSLNPRGTHWSKDDNKYGQKMMEKMGWTKGKGLGREEQGMKEHISVKFKDSKKGIGYKGNDDEWIKHYESFENVLATLNSEENSTVNSNQNNEPSCKSNNDNEVDSKKSSLETTSRTSKARVHYHKFTRGKDLSRYNVDDIGCIVGSKRAKILAEREKQELMETAEEAREEEENIGSVDHQHGITTVKGGSLQEYFAKKMEALKNKSKKIPEMPEITTTAEETCESWNLGEVVQVDDTLDKCRAGDDGKKMKKKKKKRKHAENENNQEILTNGWIQFSGNENIEKSQSETGNEEEEISARKKAKKRKHDKNYDEVNGSNYEIDPEFGKKKRKKSKVVEDGGPAETLVMGIESELGKKKRKKYQVVEDGGPAETFIMEKTAKDKANTSKKKKKKKKSKEVNSIEVPSSEDTIVVPLKKKKRKNIEREDRLI